MSTEQPKNVEFLGDSHEEIRDLPEAVQDVIGYQVHLVQMGDEPDNWRPMSNIGPGVNEIKVRESGGAFRVFYVANMPEAIYILHVFQKKTQKTEKKDIDLARERLKQVKK